MKYWDSSALVSLLVDEAASDDRRSILRRDHGIVTWWGSWIECASALNRLRREGNLDSGDLDRSLVRLQEFSAGWTEIRPLERVRRRAVRLLRVHPLRGADAVQLAAALAAADEDPSALDVVSSDARLADAARQEGFRVL